MIEIGITGAKNAGKTTLIVEMTRLLTGAGERVATVKHTSHNHTFDTEGKDSLLHRRAGASLTLAVGEAEVALFANRSETLHAALMAIASEHSDWCLVEGDRESARPKILLTRNSARLGRPLPANVVATYGDEALLPDVAHFRPNDIGEMIAYLRTLASDRSEGETAKA